MAIFFICTNKCVCKFKKIINLFYFYFLRKKERKRLMYNTIKQTAVYLKEDMGNMDHKACTKCTNQLVFSISIKLNN